jgi:hypothetical protein
MPDGIWIANVKSHFATGLASLRDFFQENNLEKLHQTIKSRSDVTLVAEMTGIIANPVRDVTSSTKHKLGGRRLRLT